MFEKVEKIGYHSNFNFECNTERGSKESLSIALGFEARISRKRKQSFCRNDSIKKLIITNGLLSDS